MGSEVIILPVIFAVIFGMFYLYITARHRERMALIDKGVDASIFYSGKRTAAPMWKVLVLNLSLLLVGIGAGIFVGNLLSNQLGMDEDVAYPGTIFLMAGMGLFSGFYLTKKLNGDE